MKKLIMIIAIFSIFFSAGCMTPETLKACAPTAVLAVDKGLEITADNASYVVSREIMTKILQDVKSLLKPIISFIDPPQTPPTYDVNTDMAQILAMQADREVKMQKMIKGMMLDLAKKISPEAIKGMLPEPAKPAEPTDPMQIVMYIMAAYAAWKGGSKAVQYGVSKATNGKK